MFAWSSVLTQNAIVQLGGIQCAIKHVQGRYVMGYISRVHFKHVQVLLVFGKLSYSCNEREHDTVNLDSLLLSYF
jgi:hypothetical protein